MTFEGEGTLISLGNCSISCIQSSRGRIKKSEWERTEQKNIENSN